MISAAQRDKMIAQQRRWSRIITPEPISVGVPIKGWNTRDPFEAETRDPYGYAGQDPINNSDPAGLSFWGNLGDSVVGPFDGLTFGATAGIRHVFGIDDSGITCSDVYRGCPEFRGTSVAARRAGQAAVTSSV